MKQSEIIKDRLKGVMMIDKMSSVHQLVTVLRSDFADILQNYMYISPSDIDIKADMREGGDFIFSVTIKTDCVFKFGNLID